MCNGAGLQLRGQRCECCGAAFVSGVGTDSHLFAAASSFPRCLAGVSTAFPARSAAAPRTAAASRTSSSQHQFSLPVCGLPLQSQPLYEPQLHACAPAGPVFCGCLAFFTARIFWGTSGILCGCAMQGCAAIEHCKDIWWLGIAYLVVGHC